jgi:hypothetical protein
MFKAFSDSLVERCWNRSGGCCQCTRKGHDHGDICNKLLTKQRQGRRDDESAWEAHSRSGLFLHTMQDCEIFCWPCYEKIELV